MQKNETSLFNFSFENNTQKSKTTTRIEHPKIDTEYVKTYDKDSFPSKIQFENETYKKEILASPYVNEFFVFLTTLRPHNVIMRITPITKTQDNRRIISQFISKKNGQQFIEIDPAYLTSPRLIDTLYHEYGHFIGFEILHEQEVNEWKKIVNTTSTNINEYSSTNYEEDWAETFTVFFKNKPLFKTEQYCNETHSLKNKEELKKKYTVMKSILKNYYIDLISFNTFLDKCEKVKKNN